jgi:hypothetical protein
MFNKEIPVIMQESLIFERSFILFCSNINTPINGSYYCIHIPSSHIILIRMGLPMTIIVFVVAVPLIMYFWSV